MASLYSNIAGDNFTDKIVTAVQSKNAGGSSGGLENAKIWGAILNAGAGKSTTRTTESGAPTFLIVALAAVALILIFE